MLGWRFDPFSNIGTDLLRPEHAVGVQSRISASSVSRWVLGLGKKNICLPIYARNTRKLVLVRQQYEGDLRNVFQRNLILAGSANNR